MKSFSEIIKHEVLRATRKAVIKNSDLIEFIRGQNGMSGDKLEGILHSGLSMTGFNISKPFTTHLSPTQGATVYEQELCYSDNDDE